MTYKLRLSRMDAMKKNKTAKSKMGRHPKKPADRHSFCIAIRLTPAERRLIEAEARRRGLRMATLVMEPWRLYWAKGGK